ncbi:hypothetical protein [Paenibacillus campi]|uniref:hypothetical protein n=1 Tax=Paenibacillus campi TaxID=3106031 RepID=UPI002AFE55E2|nr:hypothetical protein [Paenibacillus sp. SGZ-1009]
MSSNTEQLNLLKVDPVTDSQQYFNVDTMLNANWDKVDEFAGQIADKVDGDLLPRLNTAATTELILKPGTQTITVARDTPFNFSGMSGRMLLNLLGRNGNCESLTGWTFSGTATLNTANVATGAASIQITSNSNVGIMSRNVELKVGATYILAASIKLGTASGAAVSVTTIANGSLATSASDFTTSYMRFTATSSVHSIAVVTQATQGQTAYVDAIRLYEISAAEYTQLGNMTGTDVEKVYPYTEGLAGVKNPYAIRWTSAAKTDVAAMLAFDTELLAAPVPASDAERDRLELGVDGQYYKTSVWNKIILDGSLPWVYTQSWTGYKAVAWLDVHSPLSNSGFITKYDKSVLSRWVAGSSATSADSHVLDGSTSDLWITISSADSGWGDNYNPNDNDVKAYFFGWKMYDTSISSDGSGIYNRTDGANKAWARRTNGVDGSGGYAEGTLIVPTTPATNFSPYEIIYRRSSSVKVPVASEGAMSLIQGSNIIEVGSGLVLRESTKPLLYPGSNDRYMINFTGYVGNDTFVNPFSKSPSSVLQVYDNGLPTSFNTGVTTDKVTWKNGVYVDRIDGYSPDKTYSVSYFQAGRFPVVDIQGRTCDNERAILNDLVRDIGQVTRRVSATELRKLEKESATPWIAPTCLNAWSSDKSNPVAYRRKDGTVTFTGVVINGVTSNGTVIFRLPMGFKPLQEHHFSCYTYQISDGSYGSVEIVIRMNGDVVIGQGGKSYISFAGINFSTM